MVRLLWETELCCFWRSDGPVPPFVRVDGSYFVGNSVFNKALYYMPFYTGIGTVVQVISFLNITIEWDRRY